MRPPRPDADESRSGRFELVVFDVGGVLVRTGRTWAKDAALAGYSFSPDWTERFLARRGLLPRLGLGMIEGERYFALLADASEGLLTPDDVRRITAASPISEYAGIAQVFEALDAAHAETAVLCNVTAVEWERLFPEPGGDSEFPTLQRTRYRFASHLLHAEKPDVAVYREVERGTGYSAEQILFFDDRLENVAGARSVGWTAELVDHTGDTAAQLDGFLRSHGVIGD